MGALPQRRPQMCWRSSRWMSSGFTWAAWGGPPKPSLAWDPPLERSGTYTHGSDTDIPTVDQAAAVPQFLEPQIQVVCRQYGVADVGKEELQEVLSQKIHLHPEEHADEAGANEKTHVVRCQRFDLVHLTHEPELRQQPHGLLEHGVRHQNLHAEPAVPRVDEASVDINSSRYANFVSTSRVSNTPH